MKVTVGVYTRESSGYRVVVLEAPIAHIDGITVFYHSEGNFFVEALKLHGTKVASFKLVSGGHQWYIMGYYLDLDNASTI